jgi:hypothetical protein
MIKKPQSRRSPKKRASQTRVKGKRGSRTALSVARLDRLLNDVSRGLSDLPSLPPDFSRADLYDDHD